MKAMQWLMALSLAVSACGGGRSSGADAPGQGADRKYPIVLERSYPASVVYHLRVTDEQIHHSIARKDGQVLKEQKNEKVLSFTGTRKALANGPHVPTEIVVEALTLTENGQETTLLPAGTKVVAAPRDTEWRYAVGDAPATEEVAKALGSLFGESVGKGDGDAIMGSREPRAVGEQWAVNADAIRQDASFPFIVDKISGVTRLAGVRTVDGIECLEIASDIQVPSARPKEPAEPGMDIRELTISIRVSGLLPVDETQPPVSEDMMTEIAMTFEAPTPKGPIVVETKARGHKTMTRDAPTR